jgi:hypothetical protein
VARAHLNVPDDRAADEAVPDRHLQAAGSRAGARGASAHATRRRQLYLLARSLPPPAPGARRVHGLGRTAAPLPNARRGCWACWIHARRGWAWCSSRAAALQPPPRPHHVGVLLLVDHARVVQLDVEVLVYRVQGAGDGQVVFELDRDLRGARGGAAAGAQVGLIARSSSGGARLACFAAQGRQPRPAARLPRLVPGGPMRRRRCSRSEHTRLAACATPLLPPIGRGDLPRPAAMAPTSLPTSVLK